MTDWIVTPDAVNPTMGLLAGGGLSFKCALGKSGVIDAALKREGDGFTPLGAYPFRRLFYRADRLDRPVCDLKSQKTRQTDGWCDATEHENYNQLVELPFVASHEKLWREDHVYDLIVEIGHNDTPPIPSLGSAIFMHIARGDYEPTEGCIALSLPDMLAFLSKVGLEDTIRIIEG